MAPGESSSEIVDLLERGRQDFHAAARGVPETLANVRPEADRWSVLECIEHVAVVEDRFLGWLAEAALEGAPPADRSKEAALTARLADRATRRQAPETVWPTGRFATLAEGLSQFDSVRTRSAQFARDRAADLYCISTAHPSMGPLNGVEMLTIIAAHARRHAEQIREVRAALEKR